jgi:hypothetical protein
VRRARWLAIAVLLAIIATAATLYLRVVAITPVYAILWPFGDVPAESAEKTLYVETGQSVSYATVPYMGSATLLTNTSGWYVYRCTASDDIAPAGAAAKLPAAGELLIIPLDSDYYGTLELHNYNGTHGAVVRVWGAYLYAWAAKIIQTAGGVYVWHPVVPDAALRDFIAARVRVDEAVYLFVPSLDYVKFDGSKYILYYDLFDGRSWTYKTYYISWYATEFDELTPGTPRGLNALERYTLPDGTLAYVYWPVLAYFYNPSVTASFVTYLRVEAG